MTALSMTQRNWMAPDESLYCAKLAVESKDVGGATYNGLRALTDRLAKSAGSPGLCSHFCQQSVRE